MVYYTINFFAINIAIIDIGREWVTDSPATSKACIFFSVLKTWHTQEKWKFKTERKPLDVG